MDPEEIAEAAYPDAERPTVRSGLLWNTGGVLLGRIATLAFGMVLARLIVPADYGVFAIVYGVLGFGLVFANIGVGAAYIHARDEIDRNAVAAFWINALVVAIIGIGILVLAAPLARAFRIPEMTQMMPFIAVAFVVKALAAIHEANLQRDLRFRRLQVIAFTGTMVFGIVAVACASQGLGAWGLVYGLTASNVVQGVLLFLVAGLPFRFRLERERWPTLLRFSRWVFLAGLLTTALTQVDNFGVGRALGAQQLGYYAMAYQYGVLPMAMVGVALAQVMYSSFASAQHDPDRQRQLLERSIGGASLLAFPLAGLAWLIAAPLFTLVLGEQWAPGAFAFRIFAVVFTLLILQTPSPSLFYAKDRGVVGVALQASVLAAVIISLVITLPIGIDAVALGVGLVMLGSAVAFSIVAVRMVGSTFAHIFREIWPVAVCSLGALGLVSLGGSLARLVDPTLLVLVVIALVYAGIVLAALRFIFPDAWSRSLAELRAFKPSTD